NCHGPAGQGAPPASPYLAGLDARYITAAMLAWKAGTRRNDPGLQMKVVADALTPDAITDVARYYASLPPPAPLPANYVRVGLADTTRGVSTVAATARPGSARRGRTILASGQYGCAACHTIPGVRGARGIVGPSLVGFADRPFIAGRLP